MELGISSSIPAKGESSTQSIHFLTITERSLFCVLGPCDASKPPQVSTDYNHPGVLQSTSVTNLLMMT